MRAAKRTRDEEFWQPTPAEIDAIVCDLLPPHDPRRRPILLLRTLPAKDR
jgi:hypothetical protein